MNAVELLGHIIGTLPSVPPTTTPTAASSSWPSASVPDDNPFMTEASSVTEGDAVIACQCLRPGVVSTFSVRPRGRTSISVGRRRAAVQIHARQPACGPGSIPPPRHPVRHHRPVALAPTPAVMGDSVGNCWEISLKTGQRSRHRRSAVLNDRVRRAASWHVLLRGQPVSAFIPVSDKNS